MSKMIAGYTNFPKLLLYPADGQSEPFCGLVIDLQGLNMAEDFILPLLEDDLKSAAEVFGKEPDVFFLTGMIPAYYGFLEWPTLQNFLCEHALLIATSKSATSKAFQVSVSLMETEGLRLGDTISSLDDSRWKDSGFMMAFYGSDQQQRNSVPQLRSLPPPPDESKQP